MASYGLDRLTKQQMGEFIWSLCRCGTARPGEIQRKIVNLGPRYYVTTNYDDLIEQSLRKWHESQPFRTATNRHLTETASIAQTHASDYVFKPHGDASDMDSIIMSREQYRALLPQGGDTDVLGGEREPGEAESPECAVRPCRRRGSCHSPPGLPWRGGVGLPGRPQRLPRPDGPPAPKGVPRACGARLSVTEPGLGE